MPVNSKHKEYEHICKKWGLVRSIVANSAEDQIRVVDPNDINRTLQYKKDAILTNFTRLTKEGLAGLVFRKDSLMQLPDQIRYIQEDATGYKFGLDQLSQKLVGEVLETGRHGLLVDYPQEGIGDSGKVARIRPYAAESIINWRYTDIGSEYILSLLVLEEKVDKIAEDGFDSEEVCQYRVLFLNEMMEYTQMLYNDDLEPIPGSVVVPTDYSGNPLSRIPFEFVGSENNDAAIDAIPLYDMSVVNLGHYKASADLMESMFIAGQPVPVINPGEVGVEQFNEANPDGVKIGSRKGVVVGTGGDFKFAQVSPNILPQQVMKDLEKQAAAIGARLIAPPGGRETAEGARIRYGSQNSVLHTITKNIQKALEHCLQYVALFMMEEPEDSVYLLNDQFYEDSVDPNLLIQNMLLLYDRGLADADEVRDNANRNGVVLNKEFSPQVDPFDGVDDEPTE